MKQIIFNNEQQSLLQQNLKMRLDSYKESIDNSIRDKVGLTRFKNFYIKPLVSALEKITNHNTSDFNSKEKLVFVSCINEHFDDYYNESLKPSIEQPIAITKVENCKDILSKCGYYKRKKSN